MRLALQQLRMELEVRGRKGGMEDDVSMVPVLVCCDMCDKSPLLPKMLRKGGPFLHPLKAEKT